MDLTEDARHDGVRRRRGAALEEAILEAAWQQLIDGGYGSFTIDAIAERAGTSRSVLYRRWTDRNDLLEAALGYGLRRDRVTAPDTGSLRGDVLEVLRRSNATRAPLAPLMSVFVGSYFAESGRSFADLRQKAFGEQPRGAMDEILDRAVARGEIDPDRLTPRVRTVAFDLIRHELLMTLEPVQDATIIAIVDEIFLPLVSP
ncbi:putative TetR family transcriptional regulator [Microlunatus phosphovorus NM-1]|uniref:Putative TetR family transcriptional regulator n=1 Tax=Microlunatus phosphovorus (strain ATCC 700054 / DSM 10555 / JCM 9379 / NBRC 101784 / NCIMB 13414 / VKM Ac-1990 / NM-1) TaxID=1032480 RepID=F5XN34_MICPN|nr:TetR/AcrR family transcriptional regulator [Microlunatus phosphovorus]BAK36484.1 putative TetR family transcriptional regulator [Microlunatus phosphovorus NM-1]